MKRVSADDLFETRRMSAYLLSDEKMLLDCYLPLIGGNAFALYKALVGVKAEELSSHERIMSKLRLSNGEFYNAVESLEAVGLVRTFVKQDDKIGCFIYCVYAPLSPEQFFSDPLFAGTLRKYVGDKEYSSLKKRYRASQLPEDFEEATASFLSVFMPDFEDPIYLASRFEAAGHDSAKVKTDFDYRAFINRLVELGAPNDILTEQEITKAERMAALYRLDSQTVADCAYESLIFNRKKGQRLDMEALAKKCGSAAKFAYMHQETGTASEVSGDSALAAKIRLMDQVPPITFLSYLQGGHKPSSSDVRLVNKLALEIGLPNPVVNALVDYVLQRNNNILSAAYAEKVGAALMRSRVKTARDAMDYLNDASRKRKPKGQSEALSPAVAKPIEPTQNKEQAEENTSISDEELDKMIDSLYN
ncbi:MAG: DnaD domain protein [Bacilli bacterium]|nr:DnaD domain protein [Bacilli bacterium]